MQVYIKAMKKQCRAFNPVNLTNNFVRIAQDGSLFLSLNLVIDLDQRGINFWNNFIVVYCGGISWSHFYSF
jgi:hypothetical protein